MYKSSLKQKHHVSKKYSGRSGRPSSHRDDISLKCFLATVTRHKYNLRKVNRPRRPRLSSRINGLNLKKKSAELLPGWIRKKQGFSQLFSEERNIAQAGRKTCSNLLSKKKRKCRSHLFANAESANIHVRRNESGQESSVFVLFKTLTSAFPSYVGVMFALEDSCALSFGPIILYNGACVERTKMTLNIRPSNQSALAFTSCPFPFSVPGHCSYTSFAWKQPLHSGVRRRPRQSQAHRGRTGWV